MSENFDGAMCFAALDSALSFTEEIHEALQRDHDRAREEGADEYAGKLVNLIHRYEAEIYRLELNIKALRELGTEMVSTQIDYLIAGAK